MSRTTSPGSYQERQSAAKPVHDDDNLMIESTRSLTAERQSGTPDAERWASLLGRVRPGTEFLGPAWLLSWRRAFLPGDTWHEPLRYVCVNDEDGRMVGLMPLARQGKFGMYLMSVPGYYMPFRDVLLDTEAGARIATELVAALRRGGGLGLRLGPIEKSGATYTAIAAALSEQHWTLLELSRGELLYLQLPDSIEAYLPVVRGRAKKAEYFRRRMEKRGTVRIEVSSDLAVTDWMPVFDDLVNIESRSWVTERGEPRFMGAANRVFWEGLFGDAGLSAALKVWILYLDDDPVSFCLTLNSGPIRYQLINGYAEAARQHSTGYIIFRAMILDAIENGIQRICFGQGDPGHKGEWGALPCEELVDLVAMKPGLVGRAAVGTYRLLQRWRDRA
jgi:CelD/BcsL family acetyltransferase involved in cellulose biosynthesis